MAMRNEAAHAGAAVLPRTVVLLALAAVAAVLVAAVAVAGAGEGAEAAPPREITISARDGKFEGTNPRLELRAGERVALTVVNRDAAALHDFAIGGLKVRTRYLGPGESETVVFTPTKPGVYGYSCTLHPGMMDGQVVVRR